MKTIDKELINKAAAILGDKSKKVAIIPHHNPDGDAIGSAMGLAQVLSNSGQNTVVIFPNDYPDYYNWMEIKSDILFYNTKKNRAKNALASSDTLICLDFNDSSRVGESLQKRIAEFEGVKILIDHHPDPKEFCDVILSNTLYSSTAEMVFDFVSETGLKNFLDKNAAECLYTGIMTDTGSFSHNISNPNTFNVVAELLGFGVNADEIHSKVYHNFSADRMKLLGYCLNNKMEVFPEYHSAVISISQEELKTFNFQPGDTEGFVNYPLSIGGVVFSALFIEKEDHVKASFRSKGSFAANRFSAEHYNGGGHRNAAGGEANETLEISVRRFKQLLPAYLHQLKDAANELK